MTVASVPSISICAPAVATLYASLHLYEVHLKALAWDRKIFERKRSRQLAAKLPGLDVGPVQMFTAIGRWRDT